MADRKDWRRTGEGWMFCGWLGDGEAEKDRRGLVEDG